MESREILLRSSECLVAQKPLVALLAPNEVHNMMWLTTIKDTKRQCLHSLHLGVKYYMFFHRTYSKLAVFTALHIWVASKSILQCRHSPVLGKRMNN